MTTVLENPTSNSADCLEIGGKKLKSRLMLGTGKYRTPAEMNESLEASGCEVVTVALRRIDLNAPQRGVLDQIDWKRYQILPNTAGAKTAEEAITTARLARATGLSNWIKVEVIPDPKYLLPDPIGTLDACKVLVKEGFIVLPYMNADPVLALKLQEIGVAAVMPLASPIGTGQGMKTFDSVRIIIEQAKVPVIVDAGIGSPSDAALAMELGAAACLINTAVARAKNPRLMAEAMRLGIEAGRKAHLAGRMAPKLYAEASSPLEGVVGVLRPAVSSSS